MVAVAHQSRLARLGRNSSWHWFLGVGRRRETPPSPLTASVRRALVNRGVERVPEDFEILRYGRELHATWTDDQGVRTTRAVGRRSESATNMAIALLRSFRKDAIRIEVERQLGAVPSSWIIIRFDPGQTESGLASALAGYRLLETSFRRDEPASAIAARLIDVLELSASQ